MNTLMVDQLNELVNDSHQKDSKTMLIYENLARERMREAEQAARNQRLVRRLNSARRWQRISQWAAKRAERANDLL